MPAPHNQSILPLEAPPPSLWLRPLIAACARIRIGELRLTAPDGSEYLFRGEQRGPIAALRLRSPRLLLRLALRRELGLAESYMAGEWDSPELATLLELGALNQPYLQGPMVGRTVFRALDRLRHVLRPNTPQGCRRNIRAHYDLGNRFYQLWLDRTMTYSAAAFDQPDQALERAQANKYARMLASLNAEPGSRILEVGCGWGGFACAAARAGHRVTALTLSPAQLEFARRRVAQAGLKDRVELRLQDYRDIEETFDHVVSIEMFEAVGEGYWPQFFHALRRCLKPGGRAALQVITIDDAIFPRYRSAADFIQLYIFPGGMLPAPGVFFDHARAAGLEVRSRSFHGQDYAETLARWERRFLAARKQVTEQGFDRRFQRTWQYYLAYCQAGFRARRIDLMRTVLQRPANGGDSYV